MRVVFMGTPDFSVPPLERLVLDGYEVVAVYTQPDKEAGRGRLRTPSPVKKVATDLGLTVVQPVTLRGPEAVAQMDKFHPDVIVVAAFGRILPPPILSLPTYGCLNIHPSLLPKFRGSSPVATAIMAGHEFTGATVIEMDAGMDSGPILIQAQSPILKTDTTGTLTYKLFVIGAQLLLDVLPRWTKRELKPSPQDESQATYTCMLSKQNGKIDWYVPAVDIWRRVRAYYPWPGCYTNWQGKRLEIISAIPVSREEKITPGQVFAWDNDSAAFGVATAKGVLKVLEVQLEGKRAMSAAEFLRGYKQILGAVLPSS